MTKQTFSASAPGRAGIVGNPSDIYGGHVLSCSIPCRAVCTLSFTGEEKLPEDRRLWDAVMARYPLDAPVEVTWETTVPRSSGLSGSTALLAATLLAVLDARGEAPDLDVPGARIAFAELVRDIERHEAKVMCGYQDAYMISHGGVQLMDFAGKHPVEPGPFAQLKSLNVPLPFLLVTTGVERLSGSVHGPMADRWMAGEPIVREGIARAAELAIPGAEALTKGDLTTLGALMTENHAITARLGGSGEAIDQLISHCLAGGAIAAKLAGAGMGGTVIALTEEPDQLESHLRGAGYVRFMRPLDGPGALLN